MRLLPGLIHRKQMYNLCPFLLEMKTCTNRLQGVEILKLLTGLLKFWTPCYTFKFNQWLLQLCVCHGMLPFSQIYASSKRGRVV